MLCFHKSESCCKSYSNGMGSKSIVPGANIGMIVTKFRKIAFMRGHHYKEKFGLV